VSNSVNPPFHPANMQASMDRRYPPSIICQKQRLKQAFSLRYEEGQALATIEKVLCVVARSPPAISVVVARALPASCDRYRAKDAYHVGNIGPNSPATMRL